MTHFKIKVRHIHLEVFPPDCGKKSAERGQKCKRKQWFTVTVCIEKSAITEAAKKEKKITTFLV